MRNLADTQPARGLLVHIPCRSPPRFKQLSVQLDEFVYFVCGRGFVFNRLVVDEVSAVKDQVALVLLLGRGREYSADVVLRVDAGGGADAQPARGLLVHIPCRSPPRFKQLRVQLGLNFFMRWWEPTGVRKSAHESISTFGYIFIAWTLMRFAANGIDAVIDDARAFVQQRVDSIAN